MTSPIHMQQRARNALLLNLPADERALHQSTNLDGEDVEQYLPRLETVLTELSGLQRRLQVGNMATLVEVISALEDAGEMIAGIVSDARGELNPNGVRSADSAAH